MGQEGDTPYIAMELVDGENLEQLISRRAAVPTSLKLVYAMQACRAFDYAHKRGIVHRDIKPGNVMVGKDNNTTASMPTNDRTFGLSECCCMSCLATEDHSQERLRQVSCTASVSRSLPR